MVGLEVQTLKNLLGNPKNNISFEKVEIYGVTSLIYADVIDHSIRNKHYFDST